MLARSFGMVLNRVHLNTSEKKQVNGQPILKIDTFYCVK